VQYKRSSQVSSSPSHPLKKLPYFSLSLYCSIISMEAFNLSNFKTEKQSFMSTHNLFSSITKLLRLLELCLALLFFLWIVTRLPFFLSISSDFFQSPLFVFALSNAIIAALLAQSDLLSSSSSSSSATDSAALVEEQIKDSSKYDIGIDSCYALGSGNLGRKVYSRSQSLPENVNAKGENEEQTERQKLLRRSETEKEKVMEVLYPEDKLSNEEFQRTIEAFIAKQMRFLREESC